MVGSTISKLDSNSPEGELDFASSYLEMVNTKDINGHAAKKLRDYDVLMRNIGNLSQESFSSIYNNPIYQQLSTSDDYIEKYIKLFKRDISFDSVSVGRWHLF